MSKIKNSVTAVVLSLSLLVVPLVSAADSKQGTADDNSLRLTYYGAAGWEITDGNVTVLVDPFLSRQKTMQGPSPHPDDKRPAYDRNKPTVIDKKVIDEHITKADFILVHHSHNDHLSDVPYIAKKTGAKVIGTETTVTILKAYGVPADQLYAVRGGEDYQFENFSVRVVPSIHSALGEKHYYSSVEYKDPKALNVPLTINEFIEGNSLMFVARFKNHNVATMGSMNFIEREMEGLNPDILLAGINGSRLGLYNYDERLVKAAGNPPIIIPTHWDNFRLPYGFSQESGVKNKLIPFKEKVAKLSPETEVIIPTHLKPIYIK